MNDTILKEKEFASLNPVFVDNEQMLAFYGAKSKGSSEYGKYGSIAEYFEFPDFSDIKDVWTLATILQELRVYHPVRPGTN